MNVVHPDLCSLNRRVLGVEENDLAVKRLALAAGRFIDERDQAGRDLVGRCAYTLAGLKLEN